MVGSLPGVGSIAALPVLDFYPPVDRRDDV
jgi:hypothetical protein